MRLLSKTAFTLIELVMVIVIIGLLAAIIVPRFTKQRDKAAFNATLANFLTLKQAIELYYIESGKAPIQENDLKELYEEGFLHNDKQYLRKIPLNMLNNPPANNVNANKESEMFSGWKYRCDVYVGGEELCLLDIQLSDDEVEKYLDMLIKLSTDYGPDFRVLDIKP